MSEVQMTAEPSAPAAPPAATPEVADVAPQPVEARHEKPEPKAEPKAEKPTLRDSLKKAAETVEARDKAAEKDKPEPEKAKPVEAKADPKADPKAAPKEPAKEPQDRGEHGHFAAKEKPAEPAKADDPERTPPKRWDAKAQAAWKSIEGDEHAEVRREIHRTVRELEGGIQKYAPLAKRYHEEFREFDELARQSGVSPKAIAAEYVRLDRLINNPKTLVSGIEQILNGRGITLEQFAKHVTGQPGDPRQPANPGRSAGEVAMAQQLSRLDQRLTANEKAQQKAQIDAATKQVAEWAKDKPHFERLSHRITVLISQHGLTLPDAYARALGEAEQFAASILGESRLSPSSPGPAKLSEAERVAQTDKGSRSITGAPGAGSAPAAHKPSSSIKESIRRAAARVA